jgi:AraC-like DNA-binding protein
MKAETISELFGLSETYLGSYFKSQCGETLQQFTSKYKMRLIKFRLKFSDKRINEIAQEFGFSDESHLNKFFKKQQGISLTGYRKQKAAITAN